MKILMSAGEISPTEICLCFIYCLAEFMPLLRILCSFYALLPSLLLLCFRFFFILQWLSVERGSFDQTSTKRLVPAEGLSDNHISVCCAANYQN